jgi:Flp pilus assembly protein TadG
MNSNARKFGADRGGNFALMASILAVPLVIAAGVAMDLSTISRTRAELQQAMDAAVLAVAREGKEINDKQAEEIARMFVANNYHLKYTDFDIVRDGTSVRLEAKTTAGLAFGGLFGYDDWQVAAGSAADIAYASYEIALVLDTTGSMAGGKLQSMKDAVDGMIESMSAQVKDKDKLRFSLVPFATFVNVGPEFGPKFDGQGLQIAGTGASWLDLEGKSTTPQSELRPGASRFQAYRNMNQQWSGCVETRMPSGGRDYDAEDIAASQGDPRTLFVPAFAPDEPAGGGFHNDYIDSDVRPADHSTAARKKKHAKYGIPTDPNGEPLVGALLKSVVGLLGLGGGINIDSGDSGYQGFKKGPGFGCGAQPITALTNDYTKVRNNVKALNAQGTTNIMEGVAWGTRVLTPGEPFGQGTKKGELGVEKIMVVLTDGANVLGVNGTETGSNYSSFGYAMDGRIDGASASSSNTAMNARTLAACNYAKKEGITVYTIRLEEPDVKTGTMLQECASSPAHFFDAPSRTQLDEVFQTIKDRVVRLRISS